MKRFICFVSNHLVSFLEIFRAPVLWAFLAFLILNGFDPGRSLLFLFLFITFLAGMLFGLDFVSFLSLYLDEQKKCKDTFDK